MITRSESQMNQSDARPIHPCCSVCLARSPVSSLSAYVSFTPRSVQTSTFTLSSSHRTRITASFVNWSWVAALAGGLGAAYIGASFTLLRWPWLVHKKQIEANRRRMFPPCSHISHRGGAGERLENTMDAFKQWVA